MSITGRTGDHVLYGEREIVRNHPAPLATVVARTLILEVSPKGVTAKPKPGRLRERVSYSDGSDRTFSHNVEVYTQDGKLVIGDV